MKKIILITAISLFLISCGDQKPSSTSSISGNITNLTEGTKIYLDYLTPKQILVKDSTTINGNGKYSFTYQIEISGYYRLRLNNQNFVNLVLNNDAQPIINGDGNNLMDTYTVQGSNESLKFKEFQSAYKINSIKQDSINKIYQSNQNDATLFAALQKTSFVAINEMNTTFINIVNSNPSSLVSLAVVQQLDHKIYGDLFKKVDDALGKKMPKNDWYIDFHNKVAKMVNLKVGDKAPDFTINNKDDQPISLSSLEGKVVLIDFWASWCRPCRAENPNVVKAYNKFHNKGFNVLSVSLDGMPQQKNAKQDWLNAIAKDGLVWKNHVSELKGWGSQVVQLYGIEGIPFTVLIDKEGNIIGTNLRGESLENKLAEIL